MFQKKFVEEIKTHFAINQQLIPPPRKPWRLWDNAKKYGRIRQTTLGNILRRRKY